MKGVMAQQPPEPIAGKVASHGGFRNLGLRLRSAAIFAPPVFAAVYFGSPWFDALIVVASGIMVWEWARMCSGGNFTLVGWSMEAGIAVCLLALYVNELLAALAVAVAVAGAVGMIAFVRGHESPARMALGTMLIGVFCLAFLWLRAYPGAGLEFVVWLGRSSRRESVPTRPGPDLAAAYCLPSSGAVYGCPGTAGTTWRRQSALQRQLPCLHSLAICRFRR